MSRPNHKPKARKRDKRGAPRARTALAHAETNVGKLRQLDALRADYGAYTQACIDALLAKCLTTLCIKDTTAMHGTFGPSTMTSQLTKCARAQAVGIVKSWASGLYGRTLKQYIIARKGEYTRDEQRQLFTIGKYMIREACVIGELEVEQRLVDLYWSWVWDENVSGKRPRFGNSGMMLGQECVEHERSDDADGLGGWWITVSTLTPYERVRIPLAGHPKLDGKTPLAKTVLARKRHDGVWTFQFTEYVEHVPDPAPGAKKIAVDVGKRNLLVTSDGRFYGAPISKLFDERYRTIQGIRANRHRQGLTEDSKRLKALEAQLSGMVKTSVGRAVNQVIRDFPGYTIVLEDLNLVGAKGCMRFAYMTAARCFERKVSVHFVNPAYTSQECPSCHYVSRRNRNKEKFRCRSCGRISHADCVGACNLLGRSEDQQITCDTDVAEVRAILRARYFAARGNNTFGTAGTSVGGRRLGSTTDVPDAYCRPRPKGQDGTASNVSAVERSRA